MSSVDRAAGSAAERRGREARGGDALRAAVYERTRAALRAGAVRPIATESCAIADGGVRFVVRSVSSLARKAVARVREAERAGSDAGAVNPFLPYDRELFVADLSRTHLCLLNKFNVLDHHLLIVTRAFQDQEALLDVADFRALVRCLAAIDGLGFYNGGTVAGASQPHKHLQLVPKPLAVDGPAIPVEALIARAQGAPHLPGVPFRHALAVFDASGEGGAPSAAALHDCYRALLNTAGIAAVVGDGEDRQSAPYNLLVTRAWMLLVPRSVERYAGISVNALGYAGSLFVRDAEQMRTVRDIGPMAILGGVGVSAP